MAESSVRLCGADRAFIFRFDSEFLRMAVSYNSSAEFAEWIANHWSDGAILGLDLAIRHPDRVGKVLAFAANTVTSGVQEGVEKNPTFAAFIERAGHEYAKLSATPKDYDAFVAQISKMWETEPNWTDAQLQSIRAPVLVADGDHDEAIKRAHTEYIAATIPGAGLLILPNTSHFAFLQDPTLFNAALLHFLGDR